MKDYDPRDWYWVIGATPGIGLADQDLSALSAFSSRRFQTVAGDDAEYAAWRSDGTLPSRHPGDMELAGILEPHGLALTGAYHRRTKADLLARMPAAERRATFRYLRVEAGTNDTVADFLDAWSAAVSVDIAGIEILGDVTWPQAVGFLLNSAGTISQATHDALLDTTLA